MRDVLHRETALARSGALGDLEEAAAAKRAAFIAFSQACATRRTGERGSRAEREAIGSVLAAADENALVLEAVRATLQDFAARIRAALAAAADPGTYGPTRTRARHVLAASFDASA